MKIKKKASPEQIKPQSINIDCGVHLATIDDLFKGIESSTSGLSLDEVNRRQVLFGTNELKVKQDVPLYIRYLQQFKNFFALLLIVGGSLAVLAEFLEPGEGNIYIAIALFVVVILNATFTFFQEFQSERIMDSFRKMMPEMIRVRREDKIYEVEAHDLVPGDIMLLYEGNKVPADGRLLKCNGLKVDSSSLTGESEPIKLSTTSTHENMIESKNMVFSGSLINSGDGEVLVCYTGMSTQIGKIVQLTKDVSTQETPIRRELQHFIKIISAIAITLGVLFFIISIAIGKKAIDSLIFCIGIIVANVPEGLLPTVTLSLTMASKRMAKKNALIKNLESVETLGSTTVICTDKTGTLTQNKISVRRITTPDGSYFVNHNENDFSGSQMIPRTMVLCNNAQVSPDGFVGESTETALLACATKLQTKEDLSDFTREDEIPFSSATKFMVTINKGPGENDVAYLKGAPEIVFGMCNRIQVGNKVVDISEMQKWFDDTLHDIASSGERCLALAFKPFEEGDTKESNFIFLGLVGMIDPPRPEVPDALKKCHGAGIRVFMLTGDYGLTAKTIAQEIGLLTPLSKDKQIDGSDNDTADNNADESSTDFESAFPSQRVVQGTDLAKMSDEELKDVLDIKELVFARISPEQKLQVVKALQAKGEVVTVTGDGVNDAPALKNADMGVAMGLMGTDVAKEASNMILLDDNFATIVSAVEEGRTIFDNIKKFIAYILTSNVPEITPFIAFVLLNIPLPLTVILILSVDLGTDIVPALGLGAEKPESDVMKNPPRSRKERLLTKNLLGISYGIVGMIQASAGFFSYFVVLYDSGWKWGGELPSSDPDYRTATTAFFASIIICQIADVLICRTRRQSIFTVGLFTNKLVWCGIFTELALLFCISYIPALNTFFGTEPLQYWHLFLSVPFSIAILIGDEIRRVFVRKENEFVLRYLTW